MENRENNWKPIRGPEEKSQVHEYVNAVANGKLSSLETRVAEPCIQIGSALGFPKISKHGLEGPFCAFRIDF